MLEELADGDESTALEAAIDTDTVVDAETDSVVQVAAAGQNGEDGGEQSRQSNGNEQFVEDRNVDEDK